MCENTRQSDLRKCFSFRRIIKSLSAVMFCKASESKGSIAASDSGFYGEKSKTLRSNRERKRWFKLHNISCWVQRQNSNTFSYSTSFPTHHNSLNSLSDFAAMRWMLFLVSEVFWVSSCKVGSRFVSWALKWISWIKKARKKQGDFTVIHEDYASAKEQSVPGSSFVFTNWLKKERKQRKN